MKAFVGVTDTDWFSFLSTKKGLGEVNYWLPSGKQRFSAIKPSDLFLFKLHYPENFIVGGGFFAHSTVLPVSLAWDAFGEGNGAGSLTDMKRSIEKYRKEPADPRQDYQIGCILLQNPFFLPREEWMPAPADWKPNIVQGKTYDLESDPGRAILSRLEAQLTAQNLLDQKAPMFGDKKGAYGPPSVVYPRLGQGSFRIVVTDAYGRKCAVTGEKVLPVLVAGHIHPFAETQNHHPNNGILLRSDLHTLFDRGYVTVTPDYRFEVSRRIRDDFENGKDYYAYQGKTIGVPAQPICKPDPEKLLWHNESVFLG